MEDRIGRGDGTQDFPEEDQNGQSQTGRPQIAKPSNNKMRMPIEHYSEVFASSNPVELSARSGIPYDADTQKFSLWLLKRAATVKWPEMTVEVDSNVTVDAVTSASVKSDSEGSGGAVVSATSQVRILLGRLILEGKLVPGTGVLIPYTDVPWGQTYYQAFKRRCIDRLAKMFETADEFASAAWALGGSPASDGDASADFEFVNGVMIRLAVWEGDDEFPPSAQFLFSDNVSFAFTAEDLAQVGDVLLNALQASAPSAH
ncbi:MAG: DUF3786 domain-containing protein [Coriobacteriales bacterium]|jgi:hypothetical protein